jgi:hypothetical protein
MRNTMVLGIGVLIGSAGLSPHSAQAAACLPQLTGGDTSLICRPPPDEPPPPPPPRCPAALPHPATAFSLECKANEDPNQTRCATDIPPLICTNMINEALALQLITVDGWTWLTNNRWCPVHYDVGAGERVQAVCKEGCFAEDTQILVGFDDDGEPRTKSAGKITVNDTLVSLADEASLLDLDLVARGIGRPVHGPEQPALFVFEMSNGARLRVTQHHPMVLANGKILEAARVTPGASFVGLDGEPVAVLSISREHTTEHVYNYETSSDTRLGHIIVAEGVLVGDLHVQNTQDREQGAIELRR